MSRSTRRGVLRGLGSLTLMISGQQIAWGAAILAVRVWPARDYTRVAIESDVPLQATHVLTPVPYRLAVDIAGLELNPALRELVGKVRADDPYILGVRVGQYQPRVVRLVFDLKQAVRPEQFTMGPVLPYRHRLFFDLFPLQEADPLLALVRERQGPSTPDSLGELMAQVDRPGADAPPGPPSPPAAPAANVRADPAKPAAAPPGPIPPTAPAGSPPASAPAAATPPATAPMPAPAGAASPGAGPSGAASPGAAPTGVSAPGAVPVAAPPPGGPAGVTSPAPPPARPAPPPPPQAATDAERRTAQRLTIVALDPGHGGEDPGAIGPTGLREKDVVLAIALMLRDRLQATPGLRVMLTRDADYFVPLRERVRKARRVQADLFVSLHADAFLNPQARGASVFALSTRGATSEAARWMAQRENAADAVGGVNIAQVNDPQLLQAMLDMSTTAQIRDSLRVGQEVLTRIGRIGRLHKPQVEQAGFAVLKAPDIPSILVETAFISNPEEEALLRTDEYRRRLVDALALGIRRWLARHPPLARQRNL